jgi:FSR family fosmidomycin resistance protein-like MFS transporter
VRSAGGGIATALALYALGGNLGTAIGPVLAAALVGLLGWRGLAIFVVPAILAARLVGGPPASAAHGPDHAARPGPARRAAFARLAAVLALRSGFSATVATLVPIDLVRTGGLAPATAGLVLTLMLLAGVVAALVAARLADRLGPRATLVGALAPMGPLLVVYLVSTPAGPVAFACLLLVGAGNLAPYAVAVASAQACLPGREGLAAGVTMGAATALGSAALPLFGRLADTAGLHAALACAAALPLAAALLSAWPDRHASHLGSPASRRCSRPRAAAS